MARINHPTIAESEIVRPTVVEVDLERITANFRAIQRKVAPARVMPVLKANAYGHGMVETARHLVGLGADYLGVAVLEEAILLRDEGIESPILVMGGIMGNQIPYFLEYGLTITASSIEKLDQIDRAAATMGIRARVHLKIDTGMERIGVHYYNAEGFLLESLRCEHCDIEGIYSHFANADAQDLSSARTQLERFNEVLAFYERRGVHPPVRHMANSGAILQIPESYYDMVRPGILLYGVYPSSEVERTVSVMPALTWKSNVVYFKVVLPGHPVSYGSTWQPEEMVRVVTVPVGYGDGYFRRMSNKAEVLIRGRRYPVVGTICMDQIMVNIGWETSYNGDEVVLIGSDGDQQIRCEDLAEWAGTNAYEILTNINTRVPRRYHGGNLHDAD
jgi:alanine racemase